MKIPVVFAVDQNYLFFACVAITSMAKSAEADTFYHIYILVDSDFADTEHLLEKTQRKYRNIRIETICVDARIFRNAVIHNVHLTKTTFYRLVLCSLLTEEKCLYLDADVIVTEDLTELYQTEIGENYIAGCRDVWIDCMPEQEREKRRKQTGIPSMRKYVNAGVLLLNLKRLRTDGIERKFLAHLNQNYLHEDQDILNVCCYGKIVQLPAKWNLLTVLMGWLDQSQAEISESVVQAYQEKTGIIHYATPWIRPWKRRVCWANDKWWEAAREWADEPVCRKIFKEVTAYEKEHRWEKKDASYYIYLDERYYSYELRTIFKMEGMEIKPDLTDLEKMREKLRNDTKYQGWVEKYFLRYWLLKG